MKVFSTVLLLLLGRLVNTTAVGPVYHSSISTPYTHMGVASNAPPWNNNLNVSGLTLSPSEPEGYSLYCKLLNLSPAEVNEISQCFEGLGFACGNPTNTTKQVVGQIKAYRKYASQCTGVYCTLKEWYPAADYDDLITSLKDFLERNLNSLRAKLPCTFSKALYKFLEEYFKKKIAISSSLSKDIAVSVIDIRLDFDFIIKLSSEFNSWNDLYILVGEYFFRKFSMIKKFKDVLECLQRSRKEFKKQFLSRQ